MKTFDIDISYCTSVSKTIEWSPKFENTEEGLIDAIKYSGKITMTSSEDHPEFAKLRTHLDANGYISIERGWWNGDKVIKSFSLNGKKFKKGDQFPCSAAIRWVLENK